LIAIQKNGAAVSAAAVAIVAEKVTLISPRFPVDAELISPATPAVMFASEKVT